MTDYSRGALTLLAYVTTVMLWVSFAVGMTALLLS